MRYLLRMQVIEVVPEIELTEDEFRELKEAHNILSAGSAIEEKFEILLSNYLELEKEALNLSAEQMVRLEMSYERMFEARATINRRMINLLTTTKLYVDHLPHHTNEIIGEEKTREITRFLSREYDTHFEYRFMEALRNYVQHRGFPAHAISFPSSWREAKRRDMVFSFEFSALKHLLLEDKKFKKSVLDDAQDKIDLKASSRSYLECLGRVHKSVRELVAPALDAARAKIETAIARYGTIHQGRTLGLAAIQQSDGYQTVESVPLLLEPQKSVHHQRDTDEVTIYLRKR
jgi:hypothetical protein